MEEGGQARHALYNRRSRVNVKDGMCGLLDPSTFALASSFSLFPLAFWGHPSPLLPFTLRTVLHARASIITVSAPFIRPCVRSGGSGEILCALVNAIRPGTIPHVHESQLGFEQVPT